MAYKFNYSKKFESVLQEFILEYKLFSHRDKLAVAVSGGIDSMGLLAAIIHLNFKPVVIHINHQTRGIDNLKDEELVLDFCTKYSLECKVYKLNLDLISGDFENRARKKRKEIFSDYTDKGYVVLLGHHLDDSFEWTMMQKFKQSSLKSTLGIPLLNRGLARPFLTFSKAQIRRYVKLNDIPFLEDKTNNDEGFERNYFRKKILPNIKRKYPQYLKHYINYQTELALKLNLHRKFLKSTFTIVEKDHYGIVIQSTDFKIHKALLREKIVSFSNTDRGEINNELEKLLNALEKIKLSSKESKMKGPFSFSGGVKVFVLNNCLMITNQQRLEMFNQFDQEMLDSLKNKSQITMANKFPYLYLLNEKSFEKSSNLRHPLMEKSISYLKENNIPYSFRPLSNDTFSL